jgi:hypothetical protein
MVAPSRSKSRSSLPVYSPQCAAAYYPLYPPRTTYCPLPPSATSLLRLQRSLCCAFPRPRLLKPANSRVCIGLPPLCRLFALFSAFVSFVFNRLRPLFTKHPGVGYPRPTSSLKPSETVAPTHRGRMSPLLVPSYFAGLSRFCIPSPIVPVPPSQLHLLLLQEASL